MDVHSLQAKSMFGGYGIYMHELMFALVADDVLYFKTAANNLVDFEQRELAAFSYERNGKRFNMSYSEAPGEVLDAPDEMRRWASSAIDAAVIANKNKTHKKNSGKK